MKLITDIRYYESTVDNVDGTSLPSYFGKVYEFNYLHLTPVVDRFVLKLRENGFCLLDFDHLYLNCTTSLDEGEMEIAKRTVDCYHPFYRFVDIGVSIQHFNLLPEKQKIKQLIGFAIRSIIRFYCESDKDKELVETVAREILLGGEQTEIIYKQKENENIHVCVMVRVLDDRTFAPIVKIYNSDGQLLLAQPIEPHLNQVELAFRFGSISIGKKSASIKPKSNSLPCHKQFNVLKFSF